MSNRTLKAILFDLDGTLADTEPCWLAAKAAVAAAHGISWSEQDNLASVGQPTPTYSRAFVERGAKASAVEIAAQITGRVAQDLIANVSWRPGALELLRHATAAGIRTALVTMAYRPVAEAVALASGLDVFDVIISGDSVENQKPHPEPYLLALDALALTASEVVAIEDTHLGATSAQGAGVATVLVSDPLGAPALNRLRRHSLNEVTLDLLRTPSEWPGELPFSDGVQEVANWARPARTP